MLIQNPLIISRASFKRRPNVNLMLAHRLRRWPNIESRLVQRHVFAKLPCKGSIRAKAVSAYFNSKQILPLRSSIQ